MALKTRYMIYKHGQAAPVVETSDYTTAKIEWKECVRNPKGDIYRLEQTVEPDGELVSHEKYLYLVYRVRKLWQQYFNNGRKHEDLVASLQLESELDKWNERTRKFLDTHLSVMDAATTERRTFFETVYLWRKTWKERKSYSKRADCDQKELQEMSNRCRVYEKEIDKYIKDKLKLL